MTKRRALRLAAALALTAGAWLALLPAKTAPSFASSLPTNGGNISHNVAYVFDDTQLPCGDSGCGMNDTDSPNSGKGPGANIFTNAINGNVPGSGNTGTYVTNEGLSVNLTNVPLSQLDANSSALKGFDTAILYELCSIGSPANANATTAINAFLSQGGKVMIFDADGCAAGDGGMGAADWSHFMFPFTTNSPGPHGATSGYNSIESSTLTTGLSNGTQEGDSVGDANIFTTFSGNWFQAITATNVNNASGIVEAYAFAPSGGLAIYSGEDFWNTTGTSPHLEQILDNMLDQHWNPSHLPASISASGITLAPASQSMDHAAPTPVTATVRDKTGKPERAVAVTFKVLTGPDAGKTDQAATTSSGQAVFKFTPSIGANDTIQATYTDILGSVHTSNTVSVANTVSCPDYDYIGARGSGETPQGKQINDPIWYAGDKVHEYGMGQEVYQVAKTFSENEVSKKVDYFGVHYPAVPVAPNAGWRSVINLAGAYTYIPGLGAYADSEDQGVNWVIGHIDRRYSYLGCHQTKYVLVGYSQGAQVIADTLQAVKASQQSPYLGYYEAPAYLSALTKRFPDLGQKYQSLIAGVALFGDTRYDGLISTWRSDTSSSDHAGSLQVRDGDPSALNGKIVSYCHSKDPVCGLYLIYDTLGIVHELLDPFVDVNAHGKYVSDGQTQAASEYLSRLINGNAQPNCDAYTITGPQLCTR